MLKVLEVTLPVFALVWCGWLAARRHLTSEAAVEGVNTFVVGFALPAMPCRAVAAHPVSRLADARWFAADLLAARLIAHPALVGTAIVAGTAASALTVSSVIGLLGLRTA